MSERFKKFLERVALETYPEALSDAHSNITRKVLTEELIPKLPKAAAVLDVGCGQGPALRVFREHAIDAIGITVNEEDLKACAAVGLNAVRMDQNDLEFGDGQFDFVWARHVMEHSVAPYWTLSEFRRVLKGGGLLYVEVPAPDTACAHETNRNHYSVLGKRAWMCLIDRAGFAIEKGMEWNLKTVAGPDVYWSFVAKRREK